jgi:hypothetical protein
LPKNAILYGMVGRYAETSCNRSGLIIDKAKPTP